MADRLPILQDGTVAVLKECQQVSAFVGNHPLIVPVALTATRWRHLAAELEESGALEPGLKLTPVNFKRFRIHMTEFFNAGTEDQAVVNEVNRQAAQACGFQWKHENLKVGHA